MVWSAAQNGLGCSKEWNGVQQGMNGDSHKCEERTGLPVDIGCCYEWDAVNLGLRFKLRMRSEKTGY